MNWERTPAVRQSAISDQARYGQANKGPSRSITGPSEVKLRSAVLATGIIGNYSLRPATGIIRPIKGQLSLAICTFEFSASNSNFEISSTLGEIKANIFGKSNYIMLISEKKTHQNRRHTWINLTDWKLTNPTVQQWARFINNPTRQVHPRPVWSVLPICRWLVCHSLRHLVQLGFSRHLNRAQLSFRIRRSWIRRDWKTGPVLITFILQFVVLYIQLGEAMSSVNNIKVQLELEIVKYTLFSCNSNIKYGI